MIEKLKIKFILEFGCSPIWIKRKEELIGVGLPEDLLHNHELVKLLEEISKEYDNLFINTSIEFYYQGFSSENDEKAFDIKVRRAVDLLKSVACDKYIIEIEYEN